MATCFCKLFAGRLISECFNTVQIAAGEADPCWVCCNAVRAAYATKFVEALLKRKGLDLPQA